MNCHALHRKLCNQKGFTLVELAIVMAAIGILATLLVPKYVDLTRKAKEAKMRYTFESMITTAVMCQSLAQTAGGDLSSSETVNVNLKGTTLSLRYGLPTGTQMKALHGDLEGYYSIATSFYLIVYPEQGDNAGIILYRQFPNQPLWLYVDGRWERRW